MDRTRDLKLERESGKEVVNQIDNSQADEQQCAEPAHEVWGIEQMERLQNPEADSEVGYENAEEIGTTNLQNTSTAKRSHREQESNCQKQYREGARIDAINECC